MKIKAAIFGICVSALINLTAIVIAAEVYYWVDEKGVKWFSDAPTDRDAVRKNAISYPAFERSPSSTATENSEFNSQESSSTRSVKEKGEARDYPRSVSQGSEKELLGQPESVLQSKDHGPGVEYRPEQNSGYYPGLARGNAPVVTNNTKASSGLDSAPKRQEMEEYNSKVREAKAQAAELHPAYLSPSKVAVRFYPSEN